MATGNKTGAAKRAHRIKTARNRICADPMEPSRGDILAGPGRPEGSRNEPPIKPFEVSLG